MSGPPAGVRIVELAGLDSGPSTRCLWPTAVPTGCAERPGADAGLFDPVKDVSPRGPHATLAPERNA
jgi:hypothetical protein